MKPLTSEWVEKAEGDFATAEREMDISVHANYDAVCFHAQQCAEKYLKACLQEADLPFRKTHDLSELLHSLLSVHPQFQSLQEDLNALRSLRLNIDTQVNRPIVTMPMKRCNDVAVSE